MHDDFKLIGQELHTLEPWKQPKTNKPVMAKRKTVVIPDFSGHFSPFQFYDESFGLLLSEIKLCLCECLLSVDFIVWIHKQDLWFPFQC